MAKLTAEDLVTRVRSALGNVATEQLPDDFILQFLNEAQLRITSKYPFTEYCHTESLSTTAGSPTATMAATDVIVVESVVNTSKYFRLVPCDENDYDLWYSSAMTQGMPTHYFVSDISGDGNTKTLTFYPTPNAVYVMRVRYNNAPADLALTPAPNYSVLSSHWDKVLVYYALADAWGHMSEFDKSQQFGALASSAEQEAWAISNRASEVNSAPARMIRGGWGVR